MAKANVLAWTLLIAILGSSAIASPRQKRANGTRIVVIYTGEVDAKTADRFLQMVSRHVDKVIGLKVLVEPSTDAEFERDGYLALYNEGEGQLGISKSYPGASSGIEVVKNGLIDRTMGMYVLDGMFIVKAGGLHQGVASFGLEPVDEAVVRLNPALKIVERPF